MKNSAIETSPPRLHRHRVSASCGILNWFKISASITTTGELSCVT